jgi:hypothetical protein
MIPRPASALPALLATLALALPLEKAALVLALWSLHGVPLSTSAFVSLLPEAGAGALLLALDASTQPRSTARRTTVLLAVALVVATWLAVAPWAFAGTVVPFALFARLAASPEILTTAVESGDLRLPLAGWTVGLAAVLALAAALAVLLRRATPGPTPSGRRAGALAAAGLTAIALGELHVAEPAHARLAVLAASRGESAAAAGRVDPRAARELAAPPRVRAGASSPVRDVLLLVLESVRFEPASPFVHGFPEARHFDRVYAHQARSVKTLEALLFGVYPSPRRETATWTIDQYDVGALGALPALLRGHGFETSYLGAMDMKFENYLRALEVAGVERVETVRGKDRLTWGVSARTVFARVADVLEQGRAAGRRQLVIAWTTECHRPYDSLATGIDAGTDLDRYHACQHSLADEMRALLARLASSGALDETLVIAFGDHGQLFAEDGVGASPYGQHVHEKSLHVPLLVWAPARLGVVPGPPGDRRLFQLVDVPTTIAGAAGIAPPATWVGRDLLDPAEPGRDFVVLLSLLDSGVLGFVEASARKVWAGRDGRLVEVDLVRDPREERAAEVDAARSPSDAARLQTYLTVAEDAWSRHRIADKARQLTFTGASVADFGRVAVCLQSTPDTDEGVARLSPTEDGRCRRGAVRLREMIRQLPPDLLQGASALRVELRLRLDEQPDEQRRAPRARIRLGKRQGAMVEPLEPAAGSWQTVTMTLPVPEDVQARLRSPVAGSVPLGIAPVDQRLRYSLAAITLQPIR